MNSICVVAHFVKIILLRIRTLFIVIVYFSIRLSILVKSIFDESVDARQNRLPPEINSDGDSSSDK